MRYIFKSDRLGFRNWEEGDLTPFAEMNADPEVMTFFPNCLTRDQTAEMIARLKTGYAENGYTFFAVDELESQDFIGFIGLIQPNFEAFFTPCVEIGWRLKKSVWNKGYATEGANACLTYGFKTFGFSEIIAITAVVNKKSERIMQKVGMTYIGIFEHPQLALGHELRSHLVYKIERNQMQHV